MEKATDNQIFNIRLLAASDIESVASVHINAFPNNRSTKLGKRFVMAEYRWFLMHHPGLALVCEANQKVIGFVVGAKPSYGYELFRSLIPHIGLALLLRPWLLFNPFIYSNAKVFLLSLWKKRGSRSNKHSVTAIPKVNSVALASIAVLDEFHGKGVGQKLLLAFEKQVLDLGFSAMDLTVEGENSSARKAYERARWELRLEQNGKAYYRKFLNR